MVQYIARYHFANKEYTIQMYNAVEVRSVIQLYTVRNRSEEVVCSVWRTHAMWFIHCTQLFVCVSPLHYGLVQCKIV